MKIDAVAVQKKLIPQPSQDKSARTPGAKPPADNSEVVVISEEGKRNHILWQLRASLSSVEETTGNYKREEGPVDTASTPPEGE